MKWFLKHDSGDSLTNLVLIYIQDLKDYDNAIKYLNLAVKKGSVKAVINLANLYKDKKDYVKSSAYFFNLIAYSYPKDTILRNLRNDLKYSEETIRKGYELQLTMAGLYVRYKGGI